MIPEQLASILDECDEIYNDMSGDLKLCPCLSGRRGPRLVIPTGKTGEISCSRLYCIHVSFLRVK